MAIVNIGRTTLGTHTGPGTPFGGGGYVFLTKVTVGAKAVRVSTGTIYAYVSGYGGNPPNLRSRMAIYADSGGHPWSLVAVSDELTHGASLEAWLEYAFGALPLLQPGTSYHVGFIHNASGLNGQFNTSLDLAATGKVSHSKALASGSYASGPPDPFGSTTASEDEEASLYLTGDEVDPVPVGRTLTVTFDGVSATGIVLDGSTIRCSPPPHAAGTVAVVVTLDGVQSVGSYTYDPVTTVTFDGVQATEVVFLDANRIQCRTPAHAAGAVNVVADFGDGALTGVAAFTYEEEAPPEPPAGDGQPQVGVIT